MKVFKEEELFFITYNTPKLENVICDKDQYINKPLSLLLTKLYFLSNNLIKYKKNTIVNVGLEDFQHIKILYNLFSKHYDIEIHCYPFLDKNNNIDNILQYDSFDHEVWENKDIIFISDLKDNREQKTIIEKILPNNNFLLNIDIKSKDLDYLDGYIFKKIWNKGDYVYPLICNRKRDKVWNYNYIKNSIKYYNCIDEKYMNIYTKEYNLYNEKLDNSYQSTATIFIYITYLEKIYNISEFRLVEELHNGICNDLGITLNTLDKIIKVHTRYYDYDTIYNLSILRGDNTYNIKEIPNYYQRTSSLELDINEFLLRIREIKSGDKKMKEHISKIMEYINGNNVDRYFQKYSNNMYHDILDNCSVKEFIEIELFMPCFNRIFSIIKHNSKNSNIERFFDIILLLLN